MVKKSNKISARWISETRDEFRAFLEETDFSAPELIGQRGPFFEYPEWLIMFITILSVKMKIKTYVQIHKMAFKHWEIIAQGLDLTPISERTFKVDSMRGLVKDIFEIERCWMCGNEKNRCLVVA